MADEYNATMSELKKGDFFKFYPEDNINIVMGKYNEGLRCFDLMYLTVGRYPLIKDVPVIIVPRKDIFKNSIGITDEYNATISDLKKGDFFKLYPGFTLSIDMGNHDGILRYFAMQYFDVCTHPLVRYEPVIIIPRKALFKKAYRHHDW